MTYESMPTERVLALDPTPRGFGYAALELEPLRLVDWANATCLRNTESVAQAIRRLLRRLEPTVLVIEDSRSAISTVRSLVLERFLTQVLVALVDAPLPIRLYPRMTVLSVFAAAGAVGKYEIARALTSQFPELLPRLPRPRMIWESEDARFSIFDAVALGVAHLDLRTRLQTDAAPPNLSSKVPSRHGRSRESARLPRPNPWTHLRSR